MKAWTVDGGRWTVTAIAAAMIAGCSSGRTFAPPVPPPQAAPAEPSSTPAPVTQPAPQPAPPPAEAAAPRDTTRPKERVAPPRVAFQLGLMPVASTGVSSFRLAHPTFDGRGVLIAILDSGVDPGIDGLRTTSTGQPKILDLRDFSGEGEVALTAAGSGRWTGELRELPFGPMPQGDFNGNGTNRDTYRLEVTRDSAGWAARIDLNGDGSLDDEQWMHDFLVRRETFTFASARVARGRGPITGALNLSEQGGQPTLVVYLDTSGHGAHVSGIAAGYNIYGVPGFHGVAPGAQIIGLKIADNVRGGVTTTGSMIHAMEYAVRFAAERRLPLVLNMSFGVGNAREGRAVMDSIVNAFLIAHPDIFFAMAAGNDGPGTSTLGQPGSAELGVGVGASYPASLDVVQFNNPNEVLGWWSSRGAEINKPDIVAPGLAYSTVPGWDTGSEIKGGTSMASPHAAGLAAVLISAMVQEQRPWNAGSLIQALRATAKPFADAPFIDQGPGLAQVVAAYDWLRASHEAPRYRVQAIGTGSTPPVGPMPGGRRTGDVAPAGGNTGAMGAYRRDGLASPGDTIQRFRVSLVPDAGIGQRARTYRLTSSAPWVRLAQPTVTIDSVTGSAVVEVRYDAAAVARPGRYSAAVRGVSASDSTAGASFVLVNTVVVPEPGPVSVSRARLAAGSSARYFVRVPANASGLSVRFAVADSQMMGSLSLYEPTGAPARGVKSLDVGDDELVAEASVGPDDIVPGVWEIVVQAMPGHDLGYDLEARLAPVSLARGDSTATAALVVQSGNDTALVATAVPFGADTSYTLTIRRSPERRTFAVPAWAKTMVAEVEVTPDTWDMVTDFSITMFDPDGARVGNGAMNYPYQRTSADLPEHRAAGYAVTLDLFPAFARPEIAPIEARVRVRFEMAVTPPSGTAAAQRFARREVPLPATDFAAPPGWRKLILLSVGAKPADALATTRIIAVPGR